MPSARASHLSPVSRFFLIRPAPLQICRNRKAPRRMRRENQDATASQPSYGRDHRTRTRLFQESPRTAPRRGKSHTYATPCGRIPSRTAPFFPGRSIWRNDRPVRPASPNRRTPDAAPKPCLPPGEAAYVCFRICRHKPPVGSIHEKIDTDPLGPADPLRGPGERVPPASPTTAVRLHARPLQ